MNKLKLVLVSMWCEVVTLPLKFVNSCLIHLTVYKTVLFYVYLGKPSIET